MNWESKNPTGNKEEFNCPNCGQTHFIRASMPIN